jgi:hypothetical protein
MGTRRSRAAAEPLIALNSAPSTSLFALVAPRLGFLQSSEERTPTAGSRFRTLTKIESVAFKRPLPTGAWALLRLLSRDQGASAASALDGAHLGMGAHRGRQWKTRKGAKTGRLPLEQTAGAPVTRFLVRPRPPIIVRCASKSSPQVTPSLLHAFSVPNASTSQIFTLPIVITIESLHD